MGRPVPSGPSPERKADGPLPGDHRAGRLREELRGDGRRQVHVPRRRPRAQDPDPARRRARSSTSRCSRSGRPRCTRSRSGAACTAAAPGRGRRRSCSSPRGTGSSCSRERRWLSNGDAQDQADQPRAPVRDLPAARGADRVRAAQAADQGQGQARRAQRARPDHRSPPRRRRQAALPRDRLQAPQGRGAGQGRDDRVRPEPDLLHRAPALRRRRQELHARTAGRDRRRRCSSRGRRPTSGPATRCP